MLRIRTSIFDHLPLFYLWRCIFRRFRSITMTVILSSLPLDRASLTRHSAAACEAGSLSLIVGLPPSPKHVPSFLLCHRRICKRAALHASSFEMTSHSPSLARIRQSSPFVRGTTLTSGFGMINGFMYLSPACQSKFPVDVYVSNGWYVYWDN
jgi:hypothetical protein